MKRWEKAMKDAPIGQTAILVAIPLVLRALVVELPGLDELYPNSNFLYIVTHHFIVICVPAAIVLAFALKSGTVYTLNFLISATVILLWRVLELQVSICVGDSYYHNESLCESFISIPACSYPIVIAGAAAAVVHILVRWRAQ